MVRVARSANHGQPDGLGVLVIGVVTVSSVVVVLVLVPGCRPSS